MLNFGLLAAEVDSVVWGTPENFKEFRVTPSWQPYCTALEYWALAILCGVEQREPRHIYSAGRPSRWALAHILVENDSPDAATLRHSLIMVALYGIEQTIIFSSFFFFLLLLLSFFLA